MNDGVTIASYLHSEDVLVPLFPVGALGDVELARLLGYAEQAVVAAHNPEVDRHLLLRGVLTLGLGEDNLLAEVEDLLGCLSVLRDLDSVHILLEHLAHGQHVVLVAVIMSIVIVIF